MWWVFALGAGAPQFFLLVALTRASVSSLRIFSDSLWYQMSPSGLCSSAGVAVGRTVPTLHGSHKWPFSQFFPGIFQTSTRFSGRFSVILSFVFVAFVVSLSCLVYFSYLLHIPHSIFFWQLPSLHPVYPVFQCLLRFICLFILWCHWYFAREERWPCVFTQPSWRIKLCTLSVL